MLLKKAGTLEKKLLELLLENSLEGVILLDRHGIVLQANQAFSAKVGISLDTIENRHVCRLFASKDEYAFLDRVRDRLWHGGFWQGDVRCQLVNGFHFEGQVKVSVVLPQSGPIQFHLCQVAIHKTGGEHRPAIPSIKALDDLTKLATLPVFVDRLKQAVSNGLRHERSIGVMKLDLDRFTLINDSVGRKQGDQLLCIVSERLVKCLRDSDSVARIGADEFGLLLSDIDQGPGAVRNSGFVAQKIYESLSKPVKLATGEMIEITAALGITLFPQDGNSPEQLLKNADTALSHARQGGRNTYQFFSFEMAEMARQRFALENSLRQAVERNELHLYYQPQVDLVSGLVIGAEALIRWIHPERGVISPADFIPVAEETGLILPIGEWVLRTACRQMAIWKAMGLATIRVGVNLSAVQFQRQDIEKIVRECLDETKIDPQTLDLEITESAIMDDVAKAVLILNRISALGVKLSIDDFGTGYSSLSQLRHFPFKTLKIDRSFILSIEEDQGDKAIVNAIIAMAHSLDQSVIVEGVETQAQLGIMRDLKCNEMQGYLFSAPVPVAKFTEMLIEGKRLLKDDGTSTTVNPIKGG
ncbi:MAG: EAL domain-containing protein [Magnetococcales bacterium]|nr:EAL domain-containing protein [Magnetococcales bacterium]